MPLIENHPHLLLSGPAGGHTGQGMGQGDTPGQSTPHMAILVPMASSLTVITW